MPGNPLVANDLTELGRLGLAHTAESNASRHRDSELAAHMVQSVAQNRLAQQQLAQSQQRDNMNTALALAQLQDRNAQSEAGFSHAMELQKAHNDAQMDMLSKQLANALQISQINAGRMDPSLAGGIMGANIQAGEQNDENDAIANFANQELQAVEAEYVPKRKQIQTGLYYPNYANPGAWLGISRTSQERGDDALAALDLEKRTKVNAIQAKYAGKLAYDPIQKRFIGVKRSPIQFPYNRSPFVPPGPNAIPQGAPSIPAPGTVGGSALSQALMQRIQQSALTPAAPTSPVAQAPTDKIINQGGVNYQFDGSDWVPIQ